MAGPTEGESDHGDVQGQAGRAAACLPGERRWRGAGGPLQPPAGPTPRPRQALQGTQASGPPVQKGCALGARGPEAWEPETEAGEPGAAGRARPSAPPAAPGRRGRTLLAPPGRAPGQSRCPGLPTPPGLGSSLRRPPTRRPAGLTRRGGARPAAPRGSRTAVEGCPSPRLLRRLLARRPPPPAGAPHLPRAPRSHRPPAAPPPPPPAPGPSPPLRLPPQPAPPAPGSASRPRPLEASASGQARAGAVALRDEPLAGPAGLRSRLGRV